MSKILHLTMREKFTKDFIIFTKDNFDINKHFFLIVGGFDKKEFEINDSSYTKTLKNKNSFIKYFFEFNKRMYKSEKIILHGLFQPYSLIYLFLNPWLLKKCYWIIWGGDLYSFLTPKITFKSKAIEFLRRFCIKRIGNIIAYPEGDYERAVEWYNAKGKFHKCLFYPYFAVEDYLNHITLENKEEDIIMVGNSATVSNEHLEIFRSLSEVKGIEKYKILCPLSYGDKNYAKKIIKEGYNFFGDNFNPLADFMSSDDYYKLLAKVKIVIMGHKRQQATGNILALIKFGKKVFIRSNISTWDFYKENEIKVFKYETLKQEVLLEMTEKERNKNKLAIQKNFTYNRIIQEWNEIYESERMN